MRINKYFMTILAASALLASCSQENDETSKNEGKTSGMRIKISYGEDPTYAVDGSVSAGNNTTLQSALLFEMVGTNVFKVNEMTAQQIAAMTTAAGCRIENVNSTVNNVILIGNSPTSDVTALKALRTKDAIEAYQFTVSSQQSTVANPGVASVTIMGTGSVVAGTDPAPDGHIYKEAQVTAVPLVGRLEAAGLVKISTDPDNQIQSITWKSVSFNRFFTTYRRDVLTEYKPNDWASIPGWTTDTYTTATEAGAQCYAYQFFPATVDGADYLPMIVMKADVVLNNGETLTDYYITIKTFTRAGGTALTQMFNNRIYKVDLNLLSVDHTDFTPDPNPDMTDLAVKVTISPWQAETITPEV